MTENIAKENEIPFLGADWFDPLKAGLRAFALQLHPEKTRLIEFGRHAAAGRKQRGLGKPETFVFLGSTFISGQSRRGDFLLKRKSRGDRVQAKLREVKQELRRRMHQSIPEQGKWLRQVATGLYAYHGMPTNFRALRAFRHHIQDLWRRTLRRRSQKDRTTVARAAQLVDTFLPKPRILHPWPRDRFAVTYPRWEPYALIVPVRFCAGGVQK